MKTNLKSAALSKEEKTSDGYELTFMGLRKGPMSVDDVFKEISGSPDELRRSSTDTTPIILRFRYSG